MPQTNKSLLPTLDDLGDLNGKAVLVRADFNVPLQARDKDFEITDDRRIRAVIPTLEHVLNQNPSKVTALTHLGRPEQPAKSDWPETSAPAAWSELSAPVGADLRYSVEPVRRRLKELLPDVNLAENLRFHPGEKANAPAFAAQLANGYDAYVNDAFGVAHRSAASVVGVPQLLPAAAGHLLSHEVEVLGGLRAAPKRPFVAVLGGAKVSDKLGVISALLSVVDELVIGGAMCFTFLKAKGHSVGASLVEDTMVAQCEALLESNPKLHLPYDIVSMSPDGQLGNPSSGPLVGTVRNTGCDIPEGWLGADIGPGSAAEFSDVIEEAATVFWNGPMGVFEDPRFSAGTEAIAHAMANTRAFTVVGGGDSAAAARQLGIDDQVDHVSTGGGASLEFIEKGDLPGLAALRKSA